MKRHALGLLSLATMFVIVAVSASQPPPKDGPPPKKDGAPPRFRLGDLFPPHVKDDLMLTEDQEKELGEIQADVRRKLEKLLTAEQKEALDRHRPPLGKDGADNGRPVPQIAADLGVTPEQFREAFKKVRPAPRGEEPTREQREQNRKVLSEALGVDPDRLDAVMDKYRPGGRTGYGPPPR